MSHTLGRSIKMRLYNMILRRRAAAEFVRYNVTRATYTIDETLSACSYTRQHLRRTSRGRAEFSGRGKRVRENEHVVVIFTLARRGRKSYRPLSAAARRSRHELPSGKFENENSTPPTQGDIY